ncbi:MAG TPA: NAD-dependent epimerase/dehydratase family protein, partial [Beutenbergiaceae bacterium]|nr:NAD-dependent epimerase/dehydratase family protein [Beutenbergiaceae bacterium]
MTWLVTGGAGYIGSHVVRALTAQGLGAVVLDDLSTGHQRFVPDDVPFVRASILETDAVEQALTDHQVRGVIHVAGFKYAGVSVQRPLHTYTQNVTGTICVLEAMPRAGV